MSEATAIANADGPRTRESLAADLRGLGLQAGMTVIVHSSMSALGWVCGGPVAVVQALMDVVTEEGTIVMPAFDPRVTPSRWMGRIAETFRTWPGVLRSDHPMDSFCAWGRRAGLITAGHSLDYGLGEGSPLARIYDLDGHAAQSRLFG